MQLLALAYLHAENKALQALQTLTMQYYLQVVHSSTIPALEVLRAAQTALDPSCLLELCASHMV